MSLGNIFDISGSGMNAQSIRLNTTASNLANAQSVSSSIDETYRARKPIFQNIHTDILDRSLVPVDLEHDVGKGVKVAAIVEKDTPLEMRYEPSHPFANEEGYVYYPNVNVVEEMADMMSAQRSFTINVEVFNTAKTLMQKTLTLGQ
ncbi:flagellar basal body rod protein FlgC [Reinekea thalattae]|uniref:Flagellar basal-body rod protein FlgC n=1 Tax=Reinekea thalattae TaxID=2593301 RepID=A0A5C8Z7F3_9GAMM|nr:flagellar basal body rod protein FlgC [Reinekea thalattae]TXR53234.1 flagellar basal body rod protein FlgC [Reinekea thalattae]